MDNLHFRYPKVIKLSKMMCVVFIFLGILLYPTLLLFPKPEEINSTFEYIIAILATPSVLVLASIHYIGSWSEIQTYEDGIIIEFLWLKLRVPWEGIRRIEHVGSKRLGVTLILTDNRYLTIFHRIYSLYTVGSFQPGIHIHPYYLKPNNFIDTIKMAKSGKRKLSRH